ncbi:phosphatidylglycerophosphatase A [Actimicrobium sp. CCC2.4]|uniref:phosphatidylglycerophosphatase A family protein n=1 Tax=Actimicrobium sp. CCC2.4 TaxID=3048606 RepID=UPI002AC9E0F0|nr:phosphatidylglycerophosphatase A [Actimicrobium sp. CCC2.4]MEB0137380.1 phosphatidylglycerophosphatase A [Actimicrobium sp. CCC2.4]WPX31809.1 phosphatidylglycerophosphatase A [Actimicrobium sp. CCC2.4]
MLAHPAHLIAQGLGSGLSPIMPGTSGTLFGWLTFHLMSQRWPDFFTATNWAIVIVAGFLIGTWACEKTGRDLGVADHGSMVIDEIIAFWLVLLLLAPADFTTQCWAFLCFRFFDMVKPPPIGYFDRHLKGGFGVMWDDIVAAFFTLLTFAFWRM